MDGDGPSVRDAPPLHFPSLACVSRQPRQTGGRLRGATEWTGRPFCRPWPKQACLFIISCCRSRHPFQEAAAADGQSALPAPSFTATSTPIQRESAQACTTASYIQLMAVRRTQEQVVLTYTHTDRVSLVEAPPARRCRALASSHPRWTPEMTVPPPPSLPQP